MKLVILLYHIFIFPLIMFKIGEGTINYGSLIKNVHDEYMTGAIIITAATNYFSFEKIATLQKISKELSAREISSVFVNFMQLEEEIRFHGRQSARFLVVPFIDKMTEVHKFGERVANIDMSYPMQLLLFIGDSNEDHCRYCRDPIGNPFNLKFNSETLVSCCGSEYIEEWWSKSKNQTSTLPRGKLIERVNEIEWYPNGSLYSHRQSTDKKGFRIVIVKGSPYVWKKNVQLHGYLAELLTELSQVMNFSISPVIQETTPGSWDSKKSMWTGAVGAIVRGNADIGVAGLTVTPERATAVDFTLPIALTKRVLYFKKPDRDQILWDSCFKPFSGDVWIAIIIFLIVTPLLSIIIRYKKKDNLFDMICEHYLGVWGIFCQQAFPEPPKEVPLRIVCISMYLLAVVLYAAYSASLITYLTTSSLILPFNTMEEFAHDGTYKLIVVKDSSEYDMFKMSNDTVLKKMMTMMQPRDSLPLSREEGLEQVCSERVAFCVPEILKHISDSSASCEIVPIEIERINLAMILPLHNQYSGAVKYHLQKFRNYGVLSRLENKYFKGKDVPDTLYKPVTLMEIVPILATLAVGFSAALIIFCIEMPLWLLSKKAIWNYIVQGFIDKIEENSAM